MTRLLAPLMVAGWHFVTPPTGRAFVVSDSGFITTLDSGTNMPGLYVPIGCRAGLAIWSMQARGIARQIEDSWLTPLPHKELTVAEVDMLNASMARSAPLWIAGAEAAQLADLDLEPTAPPYVSPFAGWPDRGSLGTHDRAYDVALQIAGMPRVAEDWTPMGIMSSAVPNVRLVQNTGNNVIVAALEVTGNAPG